jgi:hypothetical protein
MIEIKESGMPMKAANDTGAAQVLNRADLLSIPSNLLREIRGIFGNSRRRAAAFDACPVTV